MDIKSLKAQIKTNTLNKFYIFTGNDCGIMDVYLSQMSKVTGYSIIRFLETEELVQNVNAVKFVRNARICVLRDCIELYTQDKLNALIQSYIADFDDIYVFIYSALDKRTKFYKNNTENIVEFNHLETQMLVKYVQQEIALYDRSATQLIEVCENDYSRILLEIDKLEQYCKSTNQSADVALTTLLADGSIYVPPSDTVFDFVGAVLKGKPKLAYSLLAESYACGEATLVLLSNLYTGAKQTLQVQSYAGDNLEQATGLSAFQIRMINSRIGVYSDEQLIYLMRLCREAEKAIKCGQIADEIAVKYVLARFWL